MFNCGETLNRAVYADMKQCYLPQSIIVTVTKDKLVTQGPRHTDPTPAA